MDITLAGGTSLTKINNRNAILDANVVIPRRKGGGFKWQVVRLVGWLVGLICCSGRGLARRGEKVRESITMVIVGCGM